MGDTGWNFVSAGVACRQLGYPDGASESKGGSFFGTPYRYCVLNSVKCSGNETRLDQCPLSQSTTSSWWVRAAGVRCKGTY